MVMVRIHDGAEKILARWYEYIDDVYNNNRGDMTVITPGSESPLTYREVEQALKGMPVKKYHGHNDITTEMLVATGEIRISELMKLLTMMYSLGCFSSEVNKSIFPHCHRSMERFNMRSIEQLV